MPKKGEKHKPETIEKIKKKSRKGQVPYNKGRQRSTIEKKIIGLGRKGTFNWIDNEKLMQAIRRDFAMAHVCEENNLAKPAIILYAAVAEAILRYKLNAPQEEIPNLIGLIERAHRDGLLKDSLKDKLNVIRDFRNYVHIHKELSESFDFSPGLVQLSREVCDSLIGIFNI